MLLASLAPALGLNFNNDTLNLIDNGDLANGGFPSFLSECAAGVSCATRRGGELEVVTESALFGNHLLRFTAKGNDDFTLPWFGTATTFAAEQGDTFIFSAHCRTVSGASDATLFIFNADDKAERTSSKGSCTSDTWTELSVTHTLDSADTTGVKLRFDNDGGEGAVILFDSFTLVRQATCPDVCTGDSIETCFYDPACSDPDSPDYAGGLGCNAGGQGQDCRFCGFTAEGNDEPFIDCPPPPPPATCDTTAMADGYSAGVIRERGVRPTRRAVPARRHEHAEAHRAGARGERQPFRGPYGLRGPCVSLQG